MASILYLVKDKVKVALGGGRPLAVNDVQVSTLVMNISTLRQRRQEAQASAVNTISEVPVSETVSPVQETNMNIPITEGPVTPEVAPVMSEATPMTNEAPVMDTPVEPQALETPVTPVQDSVNIAMPTPESPVIPEVAPVMPETTPITNEAPVMDTPVEPQAMETPVTPVQDSVSMEMPTPESSVIPEVASVMPETTPTTNEAPVMDTPIETPIMETPEVPVQDSVSMEMPTPETPVGVEIIESEKEENTLLKELESIHEKYNEQRKMIDEEEEKEVNAFFQRHSEEMTQKQNIIQEQLKNAEAVTEIARQTQENLNKVNAENVISFPENQDVGTSPVQGDTMTLGLEKMAA